MNQGGEAFLVLGTYFLVMTALLGLLQSNTVVCIEHQVKFLISSA